MQAIVEVTDANGDHLVTLGPFASVREAVAYTESRESRPGHWYLSVQGLVDPKTFDWQPGESVYQVLER